MSKSLSKRISACKQFDKKIDSKRNRKIDKERRVSHKAHEAHLDDLQARFTRDGCNAFKDLLL